MGRARLFVVLLGVLAALACVPGIASAAGFTWSITSDFSTSPLSNPDADSFGGHPWTYENGSGTKLSQHGTTSGGNLGWSDTGGSPFVAITGARDKVVLQPSTGSAAVVTWTSPVSGTVTVSGSVVADQPTGLLCPNANWSVTKNGSGPGGSASTTPTPYSTQFSVSPGDKIMLKAAVPVLTVNAGCAETGATFTINQAATAPTVRLLTPANGATITSGQPSFSGTADTSFGAQNTVTVRVYAGSDTNGVPIRTLPATVSNGTYSTFPFPALPDGVYTAQAEQDSGPIALPAARGFSTKNTFTLKTGAATITLNSPGDTPLSTASPTLTGIAARNQPVRLTVYPGDTTNATPVATPTGASGADGKFSIRLPALGDGEYTVIATDGAGGISHPVTFRIKVHGPALTLAQPAAGGHLSQTGPAFLGAAGHSLGDASQLTVTLYKGSRARGKSLGSKRAAAANGSWVLQWAKRLALGTYTVRVSQSDDADHTTTVTHTFQIVPANSSVGPRVDISSSGRVSVPLWCLATPGQTCSGTVLILTKKTYRTAGGGLAGRLRVMFAYVTIPGAGSVVVRRQVQPDALRALRRARKVPVVVIATLRAATGKPRSVGVSRVVTVRSARRR